MADFPSKVTTETSSPQPNQGFAISAFLDLEFIKTIPAILMMAEIVLGLLVWALIASTTYQFVPAFGWVMFVSVTLWILTIALFGMLLGGVHHKLTSVPWPLVVMVFNGVAAVLYLTAFLTNAAVIHPYRFAPYFYNHTAAAAFFGIVVTLTYGASAFFSYLAWKGDGGNAASNTVPV
ncbi:plasmolipin [Hypomesus transpacificus]|uniref:plasmolipin n=1 Tax=Hypomesus transpacificus TaxID=137520 RepID=UPI001F07E02A|nr:plasmolipin [Hypomesus transpacificus]